MKKSILVISIICLLGVFALAEKLGALPPLEREVSVSFENESVENALDQIAKKADINFSYNPQKIPTQKLVNLHIKEKPVRWVLDNMFEGQVKYKTKGDYVILQKNKQATPKSLPPKELRLSGYILDATTGDKIPGVSLFDTISFHWALTNEHGHFEFVMHPETKAIALLIKKAGYVDTSIYIEKTAFKLFLISLTPLPSEPESIPVDTSIKTDTNSVQVDSTHGEYDWFHYNLKEEIPKAIRKVKSLFDEDFDINADNIQDTFHRPFQLSLLPGISTNRQLGSQVVNDFSFNILGGYTGGTNILEIGGLFNLNKGDVSYVQIAGLSNIVEGEFYGAQFAGLTNIVRKDFAGAQFAGLLNLNSGYMEGAQVGGIANTATNLDGAQVAGVLNSVSSRVDGAQIAGIVNSAGNVDGAQIAGIFNKADTADGVQIAGILNRAKLLSGVQIGLININDHASGVSIGFFNFVKYGYHKLEFSYSDLQQAQISFRTGTRAFHNIFSFSIQPEIGPDPMWSVGYGLGTSIKLARPLSLDFDLSAYHMEKGKVDWYASDLAQAYLGFDIHFAKKFSLAFGPTFNLYVVDQFHPDYSEGLSQIPSKPMFNESLDQDLRMIGWVGGKVGLRFF